MNKYKKIALGGIIIIGLGFWISKVTIKQSEFVARYTAAIANIVAPPTSTKGVVLSPHTTLVQNTEKKKVYKINYNVDAGPLTPEGCNQKEYKPDFGGGKNVLGPFNFPVKLTFKGTIDDNLKINGVIVDKTSELRGDKCSHRHTLEYTQTIPANKAITISLIDQYGGEVTMIGELTLENTVLKDTLLKLQKRAATDDYESGAMIATFDRGMTKVYTTNTIICDLTGGIFKSFLEKCSTSFSAVNKKINDDMGKYGSLIIATTIHNHPEILIKKLLPNQTIDSALIPPSPPDLVYTESIEHFLWSSGFSKNNYAVDSSNLWRYSVLGSGFSEKNISAISAAEQKLLSGYSKNIQNYINVVNANGGNISKVDLNKL
jgi:hypothetical protein